MGNCNATTFSLSFFQIEIQNVQLLVLLLDLISYLVSLLLLVLPPITHYETEYKK